MGKIYKADASDAAIRSLSMLRDELTKVKSAQRKVMGAEKWTYDDYIREINAKIDKMQIAAARVDSDTTASVVTGKGKKAVKPDGEKLRHIMDRADALANLAAQADGNGPTEEEARNARETVGFVPLKNGQSGMATFKKRNPNETPKPKLNKVTSALLKGRY
jgi:hypothetical protein